MGFTIDTEMKNMPDLSGVLSPYIDRQVRYKSGTDGKPRRVISYGQSSAGYDIRMASKAKIFKPMFRHTPPVDGLTVVPIDPKQGAGKMLVDMEIHTEQNGEEYFTIPPNSVILTHPAERFSMPDFVMATCTGKSTYARVGIFPNITPLEPGWEGFLTIEIANLTPLPVKVYANEGIAQILFYRLSAVPDTTYAKWGGKYQNQAAEIVAAKV